MLGLLKLPTKVKEMLKDNKLSMGHARCLSKLSDTDKIVELANKVVKQELSVRDLEKIISENNFEKVHKINKKELPMHYSIFESVMREKIGTKVKINSRKIEIPFDSEKDLERILEILDIKIGD